MSADRWLRRYLVERARTVGLVPHENPDGTVDLSAGAVRAKALTVTEALAACDGVQLREAIVAAQGARAPASADVCTGAGEEGRP